MGTQLFKHVINIELWMLFILQSFFFISSLWIWCVFYMYSTAQVQTSHSGSSTVTHDQLSHIPPWTAQCWAFLFHESKLVCIALHCCSGGRKGGKKGRPLPFALCLLMCSQFLLICPKHRALQGPTASLPASIRSRTAPGATNTSGIDGMGQNSLADMLLPHYFSRRILGQENLGLAESCFSFLLSPKDKEFSGFCLLPGAPNIHRPPSLPYTVAWEWGSRHRSESDTDGFSCWFQRDAQTKCYKDKPYGSPSTQGH